MKVLDELWAKLEPLLLPRTEHPLGCHNPRVSDRWAMDAMLTGTEYTQDWAYELPEEYRTREFFDHYVEAYSKPTFGDAEKHLLMQLILDVASDLLKSERDWRRRWEKVTALLVADRKLHDALIEHWAQVGESLEDACCLTPKMRDVRKRLEQVPNRA